MVKNNLIHTDRGIKISLAHIEFAIDSTVVKLLDVIQSCIFFAEGEVLFLSTCQNVRKVR